jgi:DNA-binding NarL/FixJ family response regulator
MRNDYIIVGSTSNYISSCVDKFIDECGYNGKVLFVSCTKDLGYTVRHFGLPKIVFIETCFCGQSTPFIVKHFMQQFEYLRIVIYGFEDISEHQVKRFMRCGAESYINVRSGEKELRDAIRIILDGGTYHEDKRDFGADEDLITVDVDDISPYELCILREVSLCESLSSVAGKLGINYKTITDYYKPRIFKKTGANTPVEYLWYSLLSGLVSIEEGLSVFHTKNQFKQIKELDNAYNPEILLEGVKYVNAMCRRNCHSPVSSRVA